MTPSQFRRIRLCLGLTQSELAQRMGVTERTIGRRETVYSFWGPSRHCENDHLCNMFDHARLRGVACCTKVLQSKTH